MTPDERIAAARAELRQAANDLAVALKGDRSRRRAGLVRLQHETRAALDMGYPYRSQAGQDQVVDAVFGRKQRGTFADIGGYDGTTGSNTLFFEQMRGWTGFLVEPVPMQRRKAEVARKCPCLPYAVASSDGEAEFIEISEGYTQMSGLAGSYDPGLLAQVRADARHREAVLRVETRTLSRLLTEAGIPHPDFVSLDIEGGEVATLAAFPFAQHRVGTWAIENNTGSGEIAEIMRASGHDLIEFCGPDEIWRRHDI